MLSLPKPVGSSVTMTVVQIVNNVAGAGILTLSAGMSRGVGSVPASLLCGYEGADEFPAGLPFPVLDPVRQRPSPG